MGEVAGKTIYLDYLLQTLVIIFMFVIATKLKRAEYHVYDLANNCDDRAIKHEFIK